MEELDALRAMLARPVTGERVETPASPQHTPYGSGEVAWHPRSPGGGDEVGGGRGLCRARLSKCANQRVCALVCVSKGV